MAEAAGSVLFALLQWLNSLSATKVHSLEDISNGTILWAVLRDIDPEAFSSNLPLTPNYHDPAESGNVNLKNLEYLHKALKEYIVDRCRRKLPLPSGEPDLRAIAQSASEREAAQLLKLVLLAAIFGRFSMDFIQQLTSFSEEVQAQFFLILEEPQAIEKKEESPSQRRESYADQDNGQDMIYSDNVVWKDSELVYEERIADLVSVNKGLEQESVELKEQLESMHDLHTKLQKSYDNLEIQQQDTAERLEALRSGKGEQSMLAIQRTKMQQQETVIATLESNINSLREEINSLKADTEVLRGQTEGYQQIQDDNYELKLERDKLQRKANAADKYKQKLESLKKVEDENEALNYRVAEMQRQLKQADLDQVSHADLRRENDELRGLVSNIEQELNDSIEAKKRAEFEKMTTEAQLRQADDQATRWHSRAEQLQTLLNENHDSESPTTPRASMSNGVDLAASDTTSDTASNQASDDGLAQQASDLNEKLSKTDVEDPNLISEKELQDIIRIMKEHTQNASQTEKTSSIQEQQKLAAKIEKSRATTKELTQQARDQSSLITTLRAELASATNPASTASNLPKSTSTSPPPEPDTRFEEVLTQKINLERELQLMASAWYDQNARLMSNTVGLSMSRGRPPPEPRSFLGRQRRLVDGVLTGRN